MPDAVVPGPSKPQSLQLADQLDSIVAALIPTPAQGLGNVPISGIQSGRKRAADFQTDEIVCHGHLGGLLKHYERKAA